MNGVVILSLMPYSSHLTCGKEVNMRNMTLKNLSDYQLS